MSDGTRGRGDGELPPDPWAGLADPAPPSPPPPPSYAASRADHPSASGSPTGPSAGPLPSGDRTLWQRPGVWVAVVVLAVVLLVGAMLEPAPPSPSEPAPDAVTAAVWSSDQPR